MTIFLNNELEKMPHDNMSVEELVAFKRYNAAATAVAVNDKIVKKTAWSCTTLKEGDRVMIISAAFGG